MTVAYICNGIRTPIGRYAGALSGVRPDDLGAHVIKALLEKHPTLDSTKIDEVILGCANQAGEDNRNVARMSLLLAGLSESIPGITVNRLCASGLDAISAGARMIKAGEGQLVIAGGTESMSRAPFVMGKATSAFSRDTNIFDTTIGWRFINSSLQEKYGVDSMPETAENVAEKFNISRQDQDLFALLSQEKYSQAAQKGFFHDEISPVPIYDRNSRSTILFAEDEHPRTTTLEALSKLKTPFRSGGSVTAGNSSGVNDGACALLLASEEAVKEYDLKPRAKIIISTAAGVQPNIMGIGPVPAVRKALQLANLNMSDIDIIELNEAFASQGIAVLRELGIDYQDSRVNPHGGAIALGHPLGMSGARIVLTAMRALELRNGRFALATMCVGVGQGSAMIIERI